MNQQSNKKSSLNGSLLGAVLGSLFIALAAQITFDLNLGTTIPITAQSFAVLVLAYAYKDNTAIYAVVLYLILGSVGLPFFADGASGFKTLTGTSGGYLYGFLPAAWIMTYFAKKDWDKSIPKSLVAMTIGTAIILLFGVLHLSFVNGSEDAMELGFYPFLKGAAVKIVVGALIWPLYYLLDNYYKNKN